MGAWDDWADRFIIGPRAGVQQVLAEEATTRRAKQKQAAETEEWTRQFGMESARRDREREAAQAHARENLLLNIREQAKVSQAAQIDKETREAAERLTLARAAVGLRPPAEGEPELAPRREDLFQYKGGAAAYTAMRPEKAEEGIAIDPTKPFVGKQTGKVIRPAESVTPTVPSPFEDYNPVTQETRWNEGKKRWDIVNKSVTDMELIASTAARLFPGDQAKQETYILATSLERQKQIAGKKAEGAFPYRPLTEEEQRAMNWIEGLESFSHRFEQFSPQQLQAVTTLPGWLKAKGRTVFRGLLPQAFGKPGVAERTYAAIEALMAEAEQMAFKLGGQQLTPMEKETVMAFVPNREDLRNPVTLTSKLNNLRQSLVVTKEMRMWRLNTPRGALSTAMYDAALVRALKEAGVTVPPPIPKTITGSSGKTSRVVPVPASP